MPDITYVGESDGKYFTLFHLMADGDSNGHNRRPVMEILVSPDDKIWIAGCEGHGVAVPQETNGVAHRHTDEGFEEMGIDSSYVCIGSLAAYIVPRIATMMARVYCPKIKSDKES